MPSRIESGGAGKRAIGFAEAGTCLAPRRAGKTAKSPPAHEIVSWL
jgi:hypothetical protein